MADRTDQSISRMTTPTGTARWFARVMDYPRAAILSLLVITAIAIVGYFYPKWPEDLWRWIGAGAESDSAEQQEVKRDPPINRRSARFQAASRDSIGRSHAVVIVQTPDLFTVDGAAAYRHVVKKLNELDVVQYARSLDEAPPLNIFGLNEPILPAGHATPQRFAVAKDKALRHPFVVGMMLSSDANTVLIDVYYDFVFVQDSTDLTSKLLEAARSAAAEFPSVKMDFQVTGAVPFFQLLRETNRSNELKYQLIGYSMILLMAIILFRGFAVVAVVSFAPILGVIWTLGFIRYFGYEDNPFSFVILPVLLSLVGFTDGVHMMVHIRELIQQGMSPFQACKRALELVGMACFLTSLTTAIGMGSLVFAHHEIVREFGWSCVIGVVCTWISVMLVIPLACRTRIGNRLARTANKDFLDRLLSRIGPVVGWSVQRCRAVSFFSIAILIALSGVAMTLKPDDQKSSALPRGNPIQKSLDYLDRSMGGLDICSVVVQWSEKANLSEETLIEALQKIDSFLRSEPLIGHPLSLPRLLDALPGEGNAVEKASMIELLPPPLKLALYDPDRRVANVTFRCKDLGSAAYADTYQRIQTFLDTVDLPNTVLKLEGDPIRRWRDLYRIVTDLVMSLGSASVVIFGVLGLAYRSWRIGLISIVPNLLPLVASASWLVLTDQPLEIVSVCCFTICLGIAVDDTIHFLSRYQEEMRYTQERRLAIERSFQGVGTGMVMTTLVLVAGFSSVLFSETKDHRVFGSLGIITLATALLCDLFLLPAMLMYFDRDSSQTQERPRASKP